MLAISRVVVSAGIAEAYTQALDTHLDDLFLLQVLQRYPAWEDSAVERDHTE